MKSLKLRLIFTHAIVLVFASSFLMSCGPKRVRPIVSLKSLKFANNATVGQAAINPQMETQLTSLLGSYRGSWVVNGGSGAYQIDLTTEAVEIEETQQEYTFAKMTLTSGNIVLDSYLAVQAGIVSNTPAFAFSSTVMSNVSVSPNAFGIYLILAHNAGIFNPSASAAYLMDCGNSQNGSCTSSTGLGTARFNNDLNKI